jgi:tetrapyrrole methylase family protein/MazG family protein
LDRPSTRQLKSFSGLRKVVAALRSPDGCPWDRVQTHQSLRPYLVEETAEVLEALDEGDPEKLREELGDLLWEVLIHVQLAEEAGDFTMDDVIYSVADKLVRRHPHVFGDAVAKTPGAVIEQWDDLKRKERNGRSALHGIPPTLPALAYAQAVQRRAAKAGFAFDSEAQAWAALDEEIAELKAANTREEQAEEIGDVFFALANVARWYETDAEDALRNTSRGFSRTFRRMEELVDGRGVDLKTADVEQKMALWEEAKT